MAKAATVPTNALGLQHCMPLLVVNLGGEMLHVLEQRLGAQKVKNDKSQRVLCDVVRTMFSKRFVDELFKPQFMYKDKNVRQIFDKLAHSSVMKLNETSMSKLYSLMVMGAKFQVVRVASPSYLLDVTTEHLDNLKRMCSSPQTDGLLDYCLEQCATCYGRFSPGDWCLCRQQLLAFFSMRRVRVSIFLQRDLQHQDGTLILENGGPLCENALTPGTRNGLQTPHPLSHAYSDADGALHARRLGGNMYSEPAPEAKAVVPEVKQTKAEEPPPKRSTARAELNLLADLVGEEEAPESFRLALFDDDDEAPVFVDDRQIIDGAAQRKTVDERLNDLGFKDEAERKSDSDSDDLLDLMDSIK